MKITFLGTRGNIMARSKKHYRHTITLFSKGRNKLLILITHAHPDYVEGLKNGCKNLTFTGVQG